MKFDDFWIYEIKNKRYSHNYYYAVYITEEEHDRFYSNFNFPIIGTGGEKFWFNKKGRLHNLKGYALRNENHRFVENYFINGISLLYDGWLKEREPYFRKRIYFLREKIKTLQKLLEIPELYDEVYYRRKNEFMELLSKI